MTSTLLIQITSLSSSGEGVGSYQGMKIFVDGALPGETVSAEITQQKKSYAKARLIAIVTPCFERTKPLCPLFGECGGCQVMHLQYPAQLQLKRQRIIDALRRIGGISYPEVLSCIPSPSSLGYRNKLQLPVIWDEGRKVIGLYRKQSHEIIPIDRCMIQSPQGEEVFSIISKTLSIPSIRYILIRTSIFQEEALVIFVTNGRFSKELKKYAESLMEENSLIKGVVENLNTRKDNVILGPTFRLLSGRPYIFENLLDKTFKISPSAFFQVNPGQAENLYAKAIELANISEQDTVLDAYCGVGALALFAATRARHVYGIECISHAIADAKENARINQISNCTFICGQAEEQIALLEKHEIVFLNPPRKGCAHKLLDVLLQKKPREIVYISCDPATLARDLKHLMQKYQVKTIQPLDMFPQTMHVETIVHLTK